MTPHARTAAAVTLVAAACTLFAAMPSLGQNWSTYVNLEDRFSVNFPGVPQTRDITWDSEYRAVFPGRVYSFVDDGMSYSVTVIDYTNSERIHQARTNRTQADSYPMYWQIDVRGSIAYAAWQFRERAAEVTYDAWHYIDLVAGHQLQLTNPDESRTFAGIYLHESRLYIMEATVPPRTPPPGLFQQSLSFLDEDGNRIRYPQIYSNPLPPPGR